MSESMHEEEHTGLMKTPSQVFWVSAAAFVIPIFTIIGLVTYFSSGKDQSPGETDAAQKIAARIQKVGTVEIRDANRPLASGEDVYKTQCIACHGTGVSGAPKFGNAADWAPRIKQGYDTLLHSALAGKGAMAPQGGGNYSDVEIGRAVVYMANHGGAKFDEPAAPAAAATETAAAAPAPAAAAAPAPAPAPAPAAAAAAAPAAAAAAAPAGGGVDLAAGKKIYDTTCVACHGSGVAGAPKFGDKAAWAPRLAAGFDEVLKIATEGKGAMPPKGGSTASDADFKAAVTYLVDAAK
ncbi:MAG: cytochrome c5 family protein [Burkholderiales bacterium]|uniref:C-type cytochrome n=1 Tax=Ottowia pentelensis TaxID=511108 RepID=A0ABV6PWD8_9BURK|nr:c-type cytochrome [Ottowia sp.]MBN9406757.1 cytochrome c5 family protein [Burkholderiales bacterium]MBS0414816.1 cytochrome c5 family protein [Pseudomonadota bacterium]